jgi:hypothetical protein
MQAGAMREGTARPLHAGLHGYLLSDPGGALQ